MLQGLSVHKVITEEGYSLTKTSASYLMGNSQGYYNETKIENYTGSIIYALDKNGKVSTLSPKAFNGGVKIHIRHGIDEFKHSLQDQINEPELPTDLIELSKYAIEGCNSKYVKEIFKFRHSV